VATASHPSEMLNTHPWPGNVDREKLANCISECFDCAQTCTACADACLSEEDVAELRKCIRLNLDCADVCEATGRVMTRQTEYDALPRRRRLRAAERRARPAPRNASVTRSVTSTAASAAKRLGDASRPARNCCGQ
jgi:hypothetical protein